MQCGKRSDHQLVRGEPASVLEAQTELIVARVVALRSSARIAVCPRNSCADFLRSGDDATFVVGQLDWEESIRGEGSSSTVCRRTEGDWEGMEVWDSDCGNPRKAHLRVGAARRFATDEHERSTGPQRTLFAARPAHRRSAPADRLAATERIPTVCIDLAAGHRPLDVLFELSSSTSKLL